jgi:hypothetical protein
MDVLSIAKGLLSKCKRFLYFDAQIGAGDQG